MNYRLFIILCLISIGFAYFLSGWGPSSLLLMYVPNIFGGIESLIREIVVLVILYCPLLYIIAVVVRKMR